LEKERGILRAERHDEDATELIDDMIWICPGRDNPRRSRVARKPAVVVVTGE
jgi:hypothetical protein